MASEETIGAATVAAPPQEALYRAFIGRNADAYLPYFARRDAGGSFWSWHWPSLFTALYWALYRRQWRYAMFLVLLSIAIPVEFMVLMAGAVALRNYGDSLQWVLRVWLGVAVLTLLIPAMVSKAVYYRSARAALVATAHVGKDWERRQALADLGGQSDRALLLGLVLSCAIPLGLSITRSLRAPSEPEAVAVERPQSAPSASEPVVIESPLTIGKSYVHHQYDTIHPKKPDQTRPLVIGRWKCAAEGSHARIVEYRADGTMGDGGHWRPGAFGELLEKGPDNVVTAYYVSLNAEGTLHRSPFGTNTSFDCRRL